MYVESREKKLEEEIQKYKKLKCSNQMFLYRIYKLELKSKLD
jgi:hypothetical protein